MQPIRPLITFGATLLVAVLGMLIGSWPIILVALLVSLFSLWWGFYPASVHGAAKGLPWIGAKLDGWLTVGERRIHSASGGAVDPEVKAQLEAFYHESHELTRGGVPELFAIQPRAIEWRERVLYYLKDHLPNQAFDFDTCDHGTADPIGRLHKQQEKIRAIIRRLNHGA